VKIEIKPAYDDIGTVIELFEEYTKRLGFDLSFQNYRQELESLPGKYSLPEGRLYIVFCNGEPAGCVAMRPFGAGCCELKRLYVRPRFRGLGLGRMAVERIIEDAKELKYKKIYLDTHKSFESANALYKKLGFKTIGAYYDNPLDGVVYFSLDLA